MKAWTTRQIALVCYNIIFYGKCVFVWEGGGGEGGLNSTQQKNSVHVLFVRYFEEKHQYLLWF